MSVKAEDAAGEVAKVFIFINLRNKVTIFATHGYVFKGSHLSRSRCVNRSLQVQVFGTLYLSRSLAQPSCHLVFSAIHTHKVDGVEGYGLAVGIYSP